MTGFDFAWFCWYRLWHGPKGAPTWRWSDPPGSSERIFWAKKDLRRTRENRV